MVLLHCSCLTEVTHFSAAVVEYYTMNNGPMDWYLTTSNVTLMTRKIFLASEPLQLLTCHVVPLAADFTAVARNGSCVSYTEHLKTSFSH